MAWRMGAADNGPIHGEVGAGSPKMSLDFTLLYLLSRVRSPQGNAPPQFSNK